MTSRSSKRNVVFSITLLAFLFLLSVIKNYNAGTEASARIGALRMTVYFIILPCVSGVLLKVIVNDKKSAIIITAICMVLWAAGNALIWGGKFAVELLIALIVFPLIMLFYFMTFLTVTSKKKKVSIIIAIISALILTVAFWWGNAVILTFAK